MDVAQKARNYAGALIAAKQKHLRPGWIARRLFGAKPHVLLVEEYAAADWPENHPTGTPIRTEEVLPPGVSRDECAESPALFAFVFRGDHQELVIMDVAGPRLGVCFAMVFDEQRNDFVLSRRLWIS